MSSSSFRLSATDLVCLILIASLLYGQRWLLGDAGVGWHLRAGELMLDQRTVLREDPFLFYPPGVRPWVHDQWLSDVLFAAMYRVGGLALLGVFAAACCIGAWAFVIGPLVMRETSSAAAAAATIFLCALIGGIQWFVRPVVISFFLFALTYRLASGWLKQGAKQRRTVWLFPPLFVLWANLHPAFVLGLGALFLAAAIRFDNGERRAAVVFGLSAAATLLNPWGTGLWRSIVALGRESYFLSLNDEWLSPDLLHSAYLPFVFCSALLTIFLARSEKTVLSVYDGVLLGGLFSMSLLHQRYLPFFALVVAVPLVRLGAVVGITPPRPFAAFRSDPSLRQLPTAALLGVLACWCVAVKTLPGIDTEFWSYPPRDVREPLAAIAHLPGQPGILNAPDFGGAIAWQLWPSVQPALDDRNQLLRPEDYETFFEIARAEPGWDEKIGRTFGIVVLGAGYPLVHILKQHPAWQNISGEHGELRVFQRKVK